MAESHQVKRITPNHEAIVDWEILHPGGTMRNCADEIGMSESAISIIRNSDIFKDYRNRRLADHHSHISESVVEKTELLACTSLDVLEERIDRERREIALGGVKDTAEMALRALGFGPAAQPARGAGSNLTVIVGASPEMLADARAKMRLVNPTQELEDATTTVEQLPATT